MLTRFHPVYHSYTHLAGSRIDVERVLEPSLEDLDSDDLADDFSEPPHFYERLSPVTTLIGETPIKGRNWTDMMIKCYRMFGKIFTRSAGVLRQALEAGENPHTVVPFMSITVDPDTVVRLIERDYEAGETSYAKLIELFETGVIAPSITVPFHPILPLLPSSFDVRLCVRMGLLFYKPILKVYERYLKQIKENQMAVAFWAPEAALSSAVIEIIQREFHDFCAREKLAKPHLILLADAGLAPDVPLDHLMKRWCQAQVPGDPTRKISVVFRDPVFSGWMMTSHPSIKKIIDRTIAKVDRNLDEKQVDYTWSHFEDLEALTYSPRDAVHLEQRILKLCELGYLALSPDTFVRRKLNGHFGSEACEPLMVRIVAPDPAKDALDGGSAFGNWRGWALDLEGKPRVLPNAPYERKGQRGVEKHPGSPCWKIAWNLTRDACFRAIAGDPDKMSFGMLGLLAKMSGQKTRAAAASRVEDFLVEYSLIYWREHFVQHDLSEGDIRIGEIAARTLRKGIRKPLEPADLAVAACAAQAYYFLLDSCNSYALHAQNVDQRALFQNVVMLTLAFCNAIAAHHYSGAAAKAHELADLLQTELAGFESAYERHNLSAFGVTRADWRETIRSEISECDSNVVERAARRTAARHLAEFGYEDQFPLEDEEIPTNCGHNWTTEVNIPNYKWANPHFCGVKEA